MLRGNHEDCSRAGAGWFYFLDPSDTVPPHGCKGSAEGYVIYLDGLTIAVLDTAHAGDEHEPANRIKEYDDLLSRVFSQIASTSDSELWMLVHQPLWSSFGNREQGKLIEPKKPGAKDLDQRHPYGALRRWAGFGYREASNLDVKDLDPRDPLDALRRKISRADPIGGGAKPSLVLSGDTHLFQFFGANEPKTPVQIVVGTSGDVLEPDPKYNSMINPPGEEATLYEVKGHLWTRKTFGFLLLTKGNSDPGWTATFYDMHGDPIIKCGLKARSCH
jgi:hypothetical protein